MSQPAIKESTLTAIADAISEPRLTINDYAMATRYLYAIAVQGTSASRCAAQLLLSAYNGSNWQLDVTDLCLFNFDQQQIALQFIECRITIPAEPHDLLDNGSHRFMELQQQWRRYHINNRWKSECNECYGRGQIFINEDDENDDSMETCIACNGSCLCSDVREF